MFIYICLFIICVSIPLLSKNRNAARISMILLWFFISFRNQIGVDDGGYALAFTRINLGWDYDIEWSFKIISKIVFTLGMNYKAVFFVYGTLSILFLNLALELLFKNNIQKAIYIMSFFGLVFVSAFSVMRQFLAACLCFYALAYLFNKNKLCIPLIISFLAVFFHTGSFLAIPLILLCKISMNLKITYINRIIILLICVVCGYTNLSSYVLKIFIESLPSAYQIYESSLFTTFSSANGTIVILLCLMYFLQCFFSLNKKNITQVDYLLDKVEICQLIYLGLLLIFMNAGVASRLAFTFILFIATLPYTFIKRFKKHDRTPMLFLLCLFMFLLYISTINEVANIKAGFFIPYECSTDFFENQSIYLNK